MSDRQHLVEDMVCYYCGNLTRSGPVVHAHWLGDDHRDASECFIHPMCQVERDAPRSPAERAALLNDIVVRLATLPALAD